MATDLQTPAGPGVSSLVSDIIGDAQELMGQQLQLFKAELRDDALKTRDAIVPLAIGLGVAGLSAVILAVAAAYWLYWFANPVGGPERLPLWGSFGVVGLALAALGGGLSWAGWAKFQTFNPLPDKTVQGLQETAQWKTNRT